MATETDFRADLTDYAYLQLANHLKARIESGGLKQHTLLPPEGRLAAEYGMSLGTVRRAMKQLRSWELVYTLRGKGTFVGRRREPYRCRSAPSTPGAAMK
jgi:GntR family transcriptional regulator